MAKYHISFNDGAMTFPEEDFPDVVRAARAVVQQAKDAGVFLYSGGLTDHREGSLVDIDGTVTANPYPESTERLGGFTVVDVPSVQEALQWAAKIAVACRCAQEVRAFVPEMKG